MPTSSTQQGRLLILDRDRMEVLHELVVRGFQVYGYDFDSEISTLTVIDADRFVVQSRDGLAELCEL